MNNELQRRVSGELSTPRMQRGVVKEARSISDEVTLVDYTVKAGAKLAANIMEVTSELDEHRRLLAGADESLNGALVEIEINFIRFAGRQQRNFGSELKL